MKWLFGSGNAAQLIRKGFVSLKNDGIKQTYKKVINKLNKMPKGNTISEPKEKHFPCLGNLHKTFDEKIYDAVIDIVLPVYNGFEYLEQLFCTIEQTGMPYRLIIIDDKSTDPRVFPFLETYAKDKENVLLYYNDVNLGFVKTVNRGLNLSVGNVALVNTDIVLPPMWLERLMLPIILNDKVASTTPFTNCGTICSFPDFCVDNKIFFGMDVNVIDNVFKEFKPKYPIIPTGVGFCMGMSRKAIDKIGLLDAEMFGKGYGEENDWCRRAAEASFVNVHVENLFVYHKHGGSFETEEKKALISEHLTLLSKKYPNYNSLVENYCRLDPCERIRFDAKKRLLKKFCGAYVIVAFDHSWGGGANAYLIRERSLALNEGKEFVQVEYVLDAKSFRIEFYYSNYHESVISEGNNIEKVFQCLPIKVDEIWINELITYPELFSMLEKISDFANWKKAYVLFLLHDFFSLCPAVNLLDPDDNYCCIPEESICQKCLKSNPKYKKFHSAERRCGISAWRANWLRFFNNCSEIRAFSESSREIFCKAYPDVDSQKIIVKPHAIDYLPNISAKKKYSDTLNIAVIGAIDATKGYFVAEKMAKLIETYELNIRIVVIGYTWPEIPSALAKSLLSTGAYSREALPKKILENDIDVVFIPSIWPETFSYTTQEAMVMGCPVACFDFGAPAERIKNYEKGIIISQVNADSALNEIIRYSKSNISPITSKYRKILFVAESVDDASRYRTEHFMEELLFRGIRSELALLSDAAKKNLKEFCAIVFYKCSAVNDASYLSERARKQNLSLFFDIDDLIFDTNAVKSSKLSDGEKVQYLEKSEGYTEIMALCDGIITSTNELSKYLRNSFPKKPVCVRRNSASLEMETLSVCAGSKEEYKNDNTVYIAYFGGSCSYDRDFEVTEKPLISILRRYSDVKLQVYGDLRIPKTFNEFQNRIELSALSSDWKSLPEKIAKAHIHLAPLANTVFNNCKSESKWIEVALVGRPIVASRNSELELVINNGVTGFLCGSEKEWEEALSKLIEDKELRNRIGKNAQEEVLRTHLTRNSGDEAVKFVVGKI